MSFLEPLLSNIPVVGPIFSPHLPQFNPNLPRAQNAFTNKYQQLGPVLGSIDPAIRNSLINFDLTRVGHGQTPLPIEQSILAIRAATTHNAQTLPPQPSPRNIYGNIVRNVGELASGIVRTPMALAHEAEKVVTQGPQDVGKAFAGGNPIQVLHNLSQVPGIRMVPGAYTVSNLTGGASGIKNALSNPVFSALDLLPFAQPIAESTAISKAQVAQRALMAQGKFAAELRPIRTVLTRTLDEQGNVIPNLVGRIGEHIAQTRPGQMVADTFSQQAKAAARLEGQANIEYKQQISPEGLPSTDPVVVATRDAQGLKTKYGITNDRDAWLKSQSELGRIDTHPDITDTERAYLTDATTIQKKITDYEMSNQMLAQYGGEYYDVPTATRLQSRQSKLSTLQGRIQSEVLPRLRTTFDNFGDERVGNLITALEEGRTADANRIANGLYRGKTRLDKPQGVLRPRAVKAGEVGPADATLAAIGNIRRTLTDTVKAERRLAKGLEQNPPARFQPLIGERAADAYARTLASRSRTLEVVLPADTPTAATIASNLLARDLTAIPGFDATEFRSTIADISRTWQDMRDVEGLNPTFYHRVTPARALAAQFRGVSEHVPSIAQSKQRVSDISPGVNDIGVTLSNQGMNLLHKRASEEYISEMVKAFGVNKAELAQQYAPEARRLAELQPQLDLASHLQRLINRTHTHFDPSVLHWDADRFNALNLDEDLYLPKTVANNLKRSSAPNADRLSSVAGPITNTFRTAVLPLSPRWHVYNILGGGIMTSVQSGLGAFKYVSEARNMLRDLSSNDSELVAAAQERLPRQLVLGLGSQVREAADLNFRAGNTMRRLFEQAGVNSPVAKRFKDIASKASEGLHKVTDRSFEINQHFDDMYRVMAYLNDYDRNIRKGLPQSVAQKTAIETARRIIHQWDEYTPIERQILRQISPFYGFQQHILRFAFKYPFDHPIRADILSSLSRNELQDQGTGLPAAFMSSFFFGNEDSHGHQHAISLSGLNPFRDVANMMTLGGFVSSTNPVIGTVLEQLGIQNGQAELYPNLHYDPTSGQLVAVHDNPFVNFLSNVIPQSQILTSLIGASNAYKGLVAADPAAAKRALIASAGIPVLVRNYDLPKEYFKAEVKRQDAQAKARTDAFKSGNYSYAEQFPGLAGLAGQIQQLQSQGSLTPYQDAGGAQSNPAYANQVKQLQGG